MLVVLTIVIDDWLLNYFNKGINIINYIKHFLYSIANIQSLLLNTKLFEDLCNMAYQIQYFMVNYVIAGVPSFS